MSWQTFAGSLAFVWGVLGHWRSCVLSAVLAPLSWLKRRHRVDLSCIGKAFHDLDSIDQAIACHRLSFVTWHASFVWLNVKPIIEFRGVNDFLENLGHVHAFSVTSGDGPGDVKRVRSFHVAAAVGCLRTEPRFSRTGLIVARGAPCIQTCTFQSPKLLMQVIKCFNIESCERGTLTDMPLNEDSFGQLHLDSQDILSS